VLFVFDVLRLMTGPAGSLPKPEAAFSMLVHGILNMDEKGNNIALSSNFSGPWGVDFRPSNLLQVSLDS
jgi:hypothetical protein